MQRRWILLLLTLVIILCLPLILDWTIFANDFPSHLSNAEWAGFLGGYIGAIIGAIVSLCGILFTIKETTRQNQRDRALQVRPYCLITDISSDVKKNNDLEPPFISALYNPKEEKIEIDSKLKCVVCYIKIRNIGIGPALNLEISWNAPLIYDKTYRESANNDSCLGIRQELLAPNEEMILPIGIYIPQKWFDTSLTVSELMNIFPSQYENCIMNLKIRYADILENSYEQEFQTKTTFTAVHSSEKVDTIYAEMHLNKISSIQSKL